MRVVIVAKTRQGGSACIGGITLDGRSVRLIAAEAASNERANLVYRVGDVWEIEAEPAPEVTPPHVENVVVRARKPLPRLAGLIPFVERTMPPHVGSWEGLYEGMLESHDSGALFLSGRRGMPAFSTMFWRPDRPLTRIVGGKRVRYRYPTSDGGRSLVFVGFQEPLDVIPAGTLLRVSLAHWWRPAERPDSEARCYVQLSGWLLPEELEPDWGYDDAELLEEDAPPALVAPEAGAPPLHVLQTVFGYDEFRPLQAEIIARVLRHEDTLVVMPTGGGKSLCYQLPALLFDGLTVVVSPLISLMHDQVTQLQEWGIPGVYLNSSLDYTTYVATAQRVRRGEVKLLYVAPETLLRPETLVMLDNCRVACLAIDEAHCISEWGHDFRPEYRQLADVRARWPQAVSIALTATATPRVQRDIQSSLRFSAAATFVASFDRPNLFLEVVPKTDIVRQAFEFVGEHSGQAGIIYANTIRQVESLTTALVGQGVKALPYHGNLDGPVRHRHQTAFIQDDVQVMVATLAFGMGIDKPDVRFVMHVDLPSDVERYYQQIGRAGRDGLRAHCRLLYSYGDVSTIYHFIEQGAATERKGRELRLEELLLWAQSGTCRRRQLLAYFGETFALENCGMCDNCRQSELSTRADITIPAQKFLSCVYRTGQQFGAQYIIDVLRGSRNKRVLERRHHELSTHGVGREFSADQWKELAHQFIQQGLLTRDAEHGQLRITPQGRAVLKGGAVWGAAPVSGALTPAEAPPFDQRLFEQLRALRKRLADQRDVAPYIIFADRSLHEMATYFPHTPETMGQLYGVGTRKVEQYAALFLPVIQAYCVAHNLTEKPRPGGGRRSIVSRPALPADQPRTQAVIEAFLTGRSLAAIAETHGLARQTVINHVARAMGSGRTITPARLQAEVGVSAETQSRILSLFAELGSDRLKPIFEALEATVSYDELALLRLLFHAGET